MNILNRIHPDIPTYAELEQRIKELEFQLENTEKLSFAIFRQLEIGQNVSNKCGIIGMIGSISWSAQIRKLGSGSV